MGPHQVAMTQTRIKICGITSPEDALAVAHSGADALGLVFYPPSPRAVSADQAREIVAVLPPFITVVGLFVDEPSASIERIVSQVGIDLLQFHGDETPEFCASFSRPWMKAVRMQSSTNLQVEAQRFADARALLLDNWREGVPGGTGEAFDWSLAPQTLARPWVLAGGLTPENVGGAVARLSPAAVDVSGGVEISPGKKDPVKIAQFIAAVKSADSERR